MVPALFESTITSLPLLARGKVRDMYAVEGDKLLIVASDRVSAFDVILNDPIPGKGQVLTRLTDFWLQKLAHVLPNHATNIRPEDVVQPHERDQIKGRAVVVKRLRPILVEAVARGYLSGSGWNEYRAAGQVCGVSLPPGLQQSAKLPSVIFTPAAKAEAGEHDESVTYDQVVKLIGKDLTQQIRDVTLRLYSFASDYAASKGIIIADTKFEFGLDDEGTLHLMDEVLTPDSSRFWPASDYAPGSNPPSFDKQFLRDWLLTQNWDKTAPAPAVPADVIQKTADKYHEALERLTGGSDV